MQPQSRIGDSPKCIPVEFPYCRGQDGDTTHHHLCDVTAEFLEIFTQKYKLRFNRRIYK